MKLLESLFYVCSFCFIQSCASGAGLDQLEQQAVQDAVAAVEPCVVQLQTVGGMDRVGRTLIAQGPTTGLIVSSNGFIVSSAFNFANQPSSIIVRLPDGTRVPAEMIARDKNRMLVLLKVRVEELLPVPTVCLRNEIKVGQWAIALGRTFRADRVGISTGIVSGLNRMHGRVVQTDASVSIANYGGPLVGIDGRVVGVLVPMAPQSGGSGVRRVTLAGAEFYDSGIGFAVPLEDILSILPRWKNGEDLLPGKLGIGLKPGNSLLELPSITSVWPNSPAAKANWKANDQIIEVDGQPVSTQTQLRFQLAPRYAGDTISLKLKRGEDEFESTLTLAGELEAFQHAFLGILPSRQKRDKDESGLLIRDIWPDSPAEQVGLLPQDRLLQINDTKTDSLEMALRAMNRVHPGEQVECLVSRGKAELTITPRLSTLPEMIPADSAIAESLEAEGELPVELKPLKANPLLMALEQSDVSGKAMFYAPKFLSGVTPGLLFWLGDGTEEHDRQLLNKWEKKCRESQMVLVIAHPEDDAGWKSSDLKQLQGVVKSAIAEFRPNTHRTIVAGEGKAGQLAFALAFGKSQLFSHVLSMDAPLPRTLKVPPLNPNHRLSILYVETEGTSVAPLIRRDLKRLQEERYPVTRLKRPQAGDEQVGTIQSSITRRAFARWIDTLDRF